MQLVVMSGSDCRSRGQGRATYNNLLNMEAVTASELSVDRLVGFAARDPRLFIFLVPFGLLGKHAAEWQVSIHARS